MAGTRPTRSSVSATRRRRSAAGRQGTEAFADLVADPAPGWRQRGNGVLEDDLRLAAVGARAMSPSSGSIRPAADAEDGRACRSALADQSHRLAPARSRGSPRRARGVADAGRTARDAGRRSSSSPSASSRAKSGGHGGGRRPGSRAQCDRGHRPPRPHGNEAAWPEWAGVAPSGGRRLRGRCRSRSTSGWRSRKFAVVTGLPGGSPGTSAAAGSGRRRARSARDQSGRVRMPRPGEKRRRRSFLNHTARR